RGTAPDVHAMLQRHVNQRSPTISRGLRYSGRISSAPGALPPRSFLTTSAISAPEMGEPDPESSGSASCSLCGKQFTQKGQLKGHFKVHTGEKPYSCPDCGKSFAHSGAMNRHRLTHTGEKPYHCSVCDRSFNQSGRLREHERIHLGEKFDCPECDKSFTRASSLKNHVRLHTGERPYGCDICGRGFSRSQSLRLHRRKHFETEKGSLDTLKNDDLYESDSDSLINICVIEKTD
uniref:C2H2-type domain-containing protein n=1 Tax=Fundulus heteroclitus TaxID=8078 RepID=A0A3Q2PJP0_FUNHE